MSHNLSNEKISFSYQRLIQIVSGSFYDGAGNVVPIGTSSVVISASTAHFATTGSNTFVGNQNITGSINITGSLNQINYIDFNTASVFTTKVGRIGWNDTDGTLDILLKGGNVTLQVGQEELCRVVNKSGADMLESEYKVVKIITAQGQRLAVDLAQADSDLNHLNSLGIVTETIPNNQEGFITVNGLVREIDTTGTLQGETWTDGDILYLSPTVEGKLTNIAPVAPEHTIRMGYVVHSHAIHGKIYVHVEIGYELGELHNVVDVTTTSSYGDLLTKSGSVWVTGKNLGGSYTIGNITASNYVILPMVSSSLNYINDAEAAAGGVPLGGIYRTGNALQIRLA